MKKIKVGVLFLLLVALFSFTACNSKTQSQVSALDDPNVPTILKTTVGTVGQVYQTSGLKDVPGYSSILTITFNDTTEADYDSLMEQYQAASTGVDEYNALLFDWGKVQVTNNDGSITVNATLK